MSARSTWKGHIVIGALNIPVAAYSATDDPNDTPMRMLHRECQKPINQKRICEPCIEDTRMNLADPKLKKDDRAALEAKLVTLRDLPMTEIVKGYEHVKDTFVVFTDEELKSLDVESTKVIEVDRFVATDEIPLMHFDRPYYVGPDGAVGNRAFALIRERLRSGNKAAIGTICMYGRQNLVAIRPEGVGLVMQRLRERHEIRSMAGIKGYDTIPTEADPKAGKVFDAIIESMSGEFDDMVPHEDPRRKALLARIEAKLEGKEYQMPEQKQPKTIEDLMASLEATLGKVKGKKVPPKTPVVVAEAKPKAPKKRKVA